MKNFLPFPESELPSLLATGNKLAFRQLYISNYNGVYGYTLKFLRSSELAEDIVQDVFASVWENRRKLGDLKCIRAYLLTICKNKTLNLLARSAMETSIKKLISNDIQYFHSDLEDKITFEDCEQFLNRLIERLPPQRRLIFRSCKMEGKTYEEVACSLGISVGTVNDHIVKATRYMRHCLLKRGHPLVGKEGCDDVTNPVQNRNLDTDNQEL